MITAGPVEGFGNAAVEGVSLGVLVNRRQHFPLIIGAEMAVAVSCDWIRQIRIHCRSELERELSTQN